MIKLKKWYPVIMAAVFTGSFLVQTQDIKASELPFDIQSSMGVKTKSELDKKLKETFVIPQSADKTADTNSGAVTLPFDLKVLLGYDTKEELDAVLESEVTTPISNEAVSGSTEDKQSSDEIVTQPETETEDSSAKSSKKKTELPQIKLKSETDPADAQSWEKYEKKNSEKSYTKFIMVGDSRFVGMSQAATNSMCEWISEVSMGYNWLVDTAAAKIEASIEPGSAVVINLGVNDVDRAGDYVNYINSKVTEWTAAGADIYFMSVNPINDGYGGSVTNAAIENFNTTVVSSLSASVEYIDTYQYLKLNGFSSPDGLHYDSSTSTAIFNYCMSELGVS